VRILALDVGEKRIGLAFSDELGIISTPYGFLDREGAIVKIVELVNDKEVGLVVIGLPHLPSGDLGSQSEDILVFAKELEELIRGKIEFEDESLSSVEAEERLKKRKKPYSKGDIDAYSATIILENYLSRIR